MRALFLGEVSDGRIQGSACQKSRMWSLKSCESREVEAGENLNDHKDVKWRSARAECALRRSRLPPYSAL